MKTYTHTETHLENLITTPIQWLVHKQNLELHYHKSHFINAYIQLSSCLLIFRYYSYIHCIPTYHLVARCVCVCEREREISVKMSETCYQTRIVRIYLLDGAPLVVSFP